METASEGEVLSDERPSFLSAFLFFQNKGAGGGAGLSVGEKAKRILSD